MHKFCAFLPKCFRETTFLVLKLCGDGLFLIKIFLGLILLDKNNNNNNYKHKDNLVGFDTIEIKLVFKFCNFVTCNFATYKLPLCTLYFVCLFITFLPELQIVVAPRHIAPSRFRDQQATAAKIELIKPYNQYEKLFFKVLEVIRNFFCF